MNQLLELVYAFADEVLDANRPDVYNLLVNLVVLANTRALDACTAKRAITCETQWIQTLTK
jgi:hypothetical protein